ncbi:phosphatidate cytidylyltransferase [Stappia sp. ES.058]|uniref:phosphatidate cytidylyltransferase n=1 Tax=Stappia sp. ES.058 TaxID=1881061 RepID=UPI00087CCEE5|nr:phosphatidate cytidylyltransferase [Stappia sp. ES.058]SDU33778.1 Cytidylyltransferase family protein [Stappia sp. ES.058]
MTVSTFFLTPVPMMPVAMTVAAGLALGGLALALASVIPATAEKSRQIWPVFATEVVIVAVAVLPFVGGGLILDLALAVLAIRVGFEATQVAFRRRAPARERQGSVLRIRLLPLAAGVALALAGTVAAQAPFLVLAGVGAVLMAGASLVRRGLSDPDQPLAIALEVLVFPAVPLVFFVAAARDGANSGLLLLAFLLVETYDSYALLGGKLFGRRPAFPVLSPRKTIEGLAAGGAMLALTAGLVGPLIFDWNLAASLLVAAIIAAAAVVGDLAGSRLKRASGVKDYPAVLPRQGGALDIVDAWLIAGPALIVVASLSG